MKYYISFVIAGKMAFQGATSQQRSAIGEAIHCGKTSTLFHNKICFDFRFSTGLGADLLRAGIWLTVAQFNSWTNPNFQGNQDNTLTNQQKIGIRVLFNAGKY